MVKCVLTSDTHYGLDKNTHRIHEKWLKKLAQEITDKDIKVFIHAGDWSCNKQDQFYRTMKMFRKHISIPIVCVRGNHDLWQYKPFEGPKMYGEMMRTHEEWFKELNIHHLESGPFYIDDVAIYGFDGWYYSSNPPTNDLERMNFHDIEGAPAMPYLSSRAHKKLDALLQVDTTMYRKSVLVTHHGPYTDDLKYKEFCANMNFFEPIVEKYDFFCNGHSHHFTDQVYGKCRVLNSGSDYNEPAYLVFEV